MKIQYLKSKLMIKMKMSWINESNYLIPFLEELLTWEKNYTGICIVISSFGC